MKPIIKKLFGNQSLLIKHVSAVYRQQLTHQTITGQFIEIEAAVLPQTLAGYEPVKTMQLKNYPFPKFITAYLEEKNKPLQLF